MSGPPALSALHREWSDKKSKAHVTVDQKYDMLLLRDRIQRLVSAGNQQEQNRTADSESHATVRGTSPEMCPEKERYERTKQNRVGFFENERYMVKDFSRQAADQEMPLPTELRTLTALRTTMDYLLREMMAETPDSVDSSSGWYDFIWRRIRAVRKEITQQRLSGAETAVILEEMCRFHIIAFHIFCEADANQFDKKLNLENLNDCLATLGRIYEDMAENGKFSASVAEIRSYEMFLRIWTDKLDLVKITADLTLLPENVQQSSEILFVRRVVSACNNRVFSEYWSLMREADYCTACLMHMYLPMVQVKSLDAVYRASGGRKKLNIVISSESFKVMFGLESDMDLLRFADYYGMNLDRQEKTVGFPEGFRLRDPKNFPRSQSKLVVTPKSRGKTVAEIVSTKRLQDIPEPKIVELDSFDESGFYVGEDPFQSEATGAQDTPVESPLATNKSRFSGMKPFPLKKRDEPKLIASRVPETPAKFDKPVWEIFSPPLVRSPVQKTASPGTRPASASFRFALPESMGSPATGLQSSGVRKRRLDLVDDHSNILPPGEEKRHRLEHSVPSPRRPSVEVIEPDHSIRSPRPLLKRLPSEAQPSTVKVPRVENVDHPKMTHIVLLHARTICQAHCLLRAVLDAWKAYANKTNLPVSHFGSVDPSADQRKAAEAQRTKEVDKLIWSPFPMRNLLLSSDADFVDCSLLVLLGMESLSRASGLSRWFRLKFGDFETGKDSPIRVLLYEAGNRTLEIIVVDALGDADQVYATVKACAKNIGGVMVLTENRDDFAVIRDIVETVKTERRNRPAFPVALFSCDTALGYDDFKDLTEESLLKDFFLTAPSPSLALCCAVWESILWLVHYRARNPALIARGLCQTVTRLFCDFATIYRTLLKEHGGDFEVAVLVDIWNKMAKMCFAGAQVEVDEKRASDTLSEMVESGIYSFLEIDENQLWKASSSSVEIHPLMYQAELDDADDVFFPVHSAVAEKVLILAALTTLCDPIVVQEESDEPDFEVLLMEILEGLGSGPETPDHDSDGESSMDTGTAASVGSDGEEVNNSGKGLAVDLEALKKEKEEISMWFGDLNTLLDNLDML